MAQSNQGTPSRRAYYNASISDFLSASSESIIGALVHGSSFAVETTQRDAWAEQIHALRDVLAPYADEARVFIEFAGHREVSDLMPY